MTQMRGPALAAACLLAACNHRTGIEGEADAAIDVADDEPVVEEPAEPDTVLDIADDSPLPPCLRFVDAASTAGAPTGLAWSSAFPTVQEGLASAGEAMGSSGLDECEVWVAGGTYRVYVSSPHDTAAVTAGMRMYGGFAGGEPRRADRDWAAHRTVLDGREAGGAGRCLHVVTADGDTVVDGLTIAGGEALGSDGDGAVGGGLLVRDADDVEVANCTFEENTAGSGGGMAVLRGGATISGSAFMGNEADYGGCVVVHESRVVVRDTSFSLSSPGYGGGILAGESEIVVESSVFEGTVSVPDSDIDGIMLYAGSLRITSSAFSSLDGSIYTQGCDAVLIEGCTFRDNTDRAIETVESVVEISASVFTGSTSPQCGAVKSVDSDVRISESVFTGNTSYSTGGAICSGSGVMEIASCVFVDNHAYSKGGAVLNRGTLAVIGSSFTGNTAGLLGGAISSGSGCTVTNSVLWDDGNGEFEDLFPSIPCQVTWSLVEGGREGTSNIDADPLYEDPGGGNLRLGPGSPCIDAADGGMASDLDIEGNPRIDDPATPDTGTGDPPYADMGAYEYHP